MSTTSRWPCVTRRAISASTASARAAARGAAHERDHAEVAREAAAVLHLDERAHAVEPRVGLDAADRADVAGDERRRLLAALRDDDDVLGQAGERVRGEVRAAARDVDAAVRPRGPRGLPCATSRRLVRDAAGVDDGDVGAPRRARRARRRAAARARRARRRARPCSRGSGPRTSPRPGTVNGVSLCVCERAAPRRRTVSARAGSESGSCRARRSGCASLDRAGGRRCLTGVTGGARARRDVA